MSELYPVGSWYISYFLSDQFDNIFKSWATPTRVAFTAGLCIGFSVGLGFGYSGRNLKSRITGFASGVQALRWKTGSLRLSGDFDKAKEEMLEKVSPFFANDNGLFSKLRESMGCQTEMAEGDIRSLMNAVAPNLMVDYNNRDLGVANFFSKVIEFLKDSKKVKNELDGHANGLTRRCFEADILLIHGEDDNELASQIESSIKSNEVSVQLVGHVGIGKPRFSGLCNLAFKQYIYVFIVVNDKLKDDVLATFSSEMLRVNSLFNAKGRVIPVQTTAVRTEYIVSRFPEHCTQIPWKFGTDGSNKQLESVIQRANEELFETTNSNE